MLRPRLSTLFAAWSAALLLVSVAVLATLALAALGARSEAEAQARAEAVVSGADPRRLVASAGLVPRWVPIRAARAEVAGAAAPLRERALDSGLPAVGQVENGDVLAVRVLRDGAGEPTGYIEVRIDAASIRAPAARLRREIFSAALLLSALGLAGIALLARRLHRSVDLLAAAAERIGAGDLRTPVAAPPETDLAALAASLDDGRRRLRALGEEVDGRRAEMEVIVEGISDGVLAVDEERRVRFVNARAAEVLGIDASAALGRFCGDLLEPAEIEGQRPCESRCPILHARFQGPSRQLERLRGGAAAEPVLVAASPPRAGTQVVLLRAESARESGRRLRDAVLANLSHEFKTPLAAQLAAAELLAEHLPADDATAHRLLATQRRGTLRLLYLVDNLLESARLEAGRDAIRRRPVDPRRLVEEASAQVLPLFEQREQVLTTRLADSLPEIEGDEARLTQVLVNLLANAQKFSPPQTTVAIGADADGSGAVRLWVEDEGPGMPAGATGSLFERFARAEPEPDAQGAGLGLAIARSIVERHGGRLEFLPTARGTRAEILLGVGAPAWASAS